MEEVSGNKAAKYTYILAQQKGYVVLCWMCLNACVQTQWTVSLVFLTLVLVGFDFSLKRTEEEVANVVHRVVILGADG